MGRYGIVYTAAAILFCMLGILGMIDLAMAFFRYSRNHADARRHGRHFLVAVTTATVGLMMLLIQLRFDALDLWMAITVSTSAAIVVVSITAAIGRWRYRRRLWE